MNEKIKLEKTKRCLLCGKITNNWRKVISQKTLQKISKQLGTKIYEQAIICEECYQNIKR